VVGALGLAQFVVLTRWMAYIAERQGTESPSYGTTLGAQLALMRALCARPEPALVVRNETAMYRFPLEYLASTEPACRAKAILVCAAAPDALARPCPPPAVGTPLLRLRYARERGGALTLAVSGQ